MDKGTSCLDDFSETKKTRMEGVKPPVSVLGHGRKARTEGMGCNAAARPLEKAKHTILAWARKCLDLQPVLCLSAWGHACLEGVIEGDDAETQVQQHVPPEQSRGWTIVLMDRARRGMWAFDGGKKDRRLLHKAIPTWDKMARQTHALRILTDGERR
jgi:hypothetical protein